MSSLSAVGRSAAARKNDRASLCSFTFSDGRRCRTPRIGKHPRFCFYHAQKEARARAAETLGKDLAYFFSGDYLSACDLSTALARLIPAVVRGDVKPKTAHTLAYLAQTLMQAIHISQDEYINAFGTDGWRKSVRNSVKGNYDYRFPSTPSEAEGPDPKPDQPAPSALRTNLRSESPQPPPQPPRPQTQAQQTTPAHAEPHMSCHSEHREEPAFSPPPGPSPTSTRAAHSAPTPPQPAEIPASCHSERSEEPAFSSSPTQCPTSAPAPQTPAAHTALSHTAELSVSCHSERSEESAFSESQAALSHPIPATQPARPAASPESSPRTGPSKPPPAPNRDARAVHFDHNCRLLIDGKLF